MQKRRDTYNPGDWRARRSSLHHLRLFLSNLSSLATLSLFLALSTYVTVLAIFKSGMAFQWLPKLFPLPGTSSLPYELTAPALGLLLVFMMKLSDSRLVEYRKVWVNIVSRADHMAGIVISTMKTERDATEDVWIKRALLNYIMAFPIALKCYVSGVSDVRTDLQNLIEEDDLAIICNSTHRPHCVIEFIRESFEVASFQGSKQNTL